jgi:hypothetical protein
MIAKAVFIGFLALLAAIEFGELRNAVLLSVGRLHRCAAITSRYSQTSYTRKRFELPRIRLVGPKQLCSPCDCGPALAAYAAATPGGPVLSIALLPKLRISPVACRSSHSAPSISSGG